VVGTSDDTTLTITPAAAMADHPAGAPFQLTLGRGDVAQLQSLGGADLTGTRVQSSAPVAVIGGSQCAQVPVEDSACNPIEAQVPATSQWGERFLIEPLAVRTDGDPIRVLAARDGTAVTIDGTLVATLAAGEHYDTTLTAAGEIATSAPALVAQYSASYSFDHHSVEPSAGPSPDPTLLLVPPVAQFLPEHRFATPDAPGWFASHLNVVAPTASLAQLRLDGAPVDPAAFAPIGASGFSGAQLPIAEGEHTLSGTAPSSAIVYGFPATTPELPTDALDGYDAYGFVATFGTAPLAGGLALSPGDQSVQVGERACVTATATDDAGAPLAGALVDYDVAGADTAAGTVTTGADGTAQICFMPSAAGADAIAATSDGHAAGATVTARAVPAPPPPTAAAGAAGAASPLVPPVLTHVVLNHTCVRDVTLRGATLRGLKGLAVAYHLNVDADVHYYLQKVAHSPRFVRCPKPRKGPVERFGPISQLSGPGAGGGNQSSIATMAGAKRPSPRRLAPGTYLLTLRATNAAGRSNDVTVKFWVLTPAKKKAKHAH